MTMVVRQGLAFLTLVFSVQHLAAEPLPPPSGKVILTVSGDIPVANVGESAQFDLDGLRALGLTTIETTTVWTEGKQVFQGVSLKDLLARLNVTTGEIKARAINDYSVIIPVTDAVEGGPIIAYLLNGDIMTIRDKGPLWVIYPFDSAPRYRTEVIYSRSVWQLDRLEITR